MEYQYIFEKHGQIADTGNLMKNEIWLDVGNAEPPGCFDHHHQSVNRAFGSTFSALWSKKDLLGDLQRKAEEKQEVTIHTHVSPDMDALLSIYLLRAILEPERETSRILFGENGKGALIDQVAKYVDDIDSGKRKEVTYPTFYAVYTKLDCDLPGKKDETQRKIVERGLALIDTVLYELRENPEFDLGSGNLENVLPREFRIQTDRLSAEANIYREEKAGVIDVQSVQIWTKGENPKLAGVEGAIWKELSRTDNGYIYARKEGKVLTVTPKVIKGVGGAETTRVIASLNPELDGKDQYTLRPIAELLEQLEQVEEQRLFEETGSYRRDHSRPRASGGFLSKMPFAASSDPWYIRPEGDLVDSPRSGSVLSYEDILEIIKHNGSALKRSYVVPVCADSEGTAPERTYGPYGNMPLCSWLEEVKGIIAEEKSHVVVFGELDASLIRHNNRILEAYCMNLTGRPFHEKADEHISFLDYRTCIYSDLECTIILLATYDGIHLKRLRLSKILDISSEEAFRSSRLLADIRILCRERAELLESGKEIGEIGPSDRKKIEELNRRVLKLSTKMQQADMIGEATERSVYFFIKQEFGTAELKASIMDDLEVLINESRNKLVSKFNIMSAFAVPFVLIATVFQMGTLKFDEIFSLKGASAWIGWGVTLLFIIVLVLIIAGSGSKDSESKRAK